MQVSTPNGIFSGMTSTDSRLYILSESVRYVRHWERIEEPSARLLRVQAQGPARPAAERAASSYYGSRDPGPSPTDAAAECERLLALDRDASAWAVLGLTGHDRGAARQRYHVLARLLHPDKCSQRGAADAFKRVADAFRRIDGSSSF